MNTIETIDEFINEPIVKISFVSFIIGCVGGLIGGWCNGYVAHHMDISEYINNDQINIKKEHCGFVPKNDNTD